MDVLSIVSNVQQVSPEELAISQERSRSSARFVCVSLLPATNLVHLLHGLTLYVHMYCFSEFAYFACFLCVEFLTLLKMY